MDQVWINTDNTSKQFTCAYCGRAVASSAGYVAMESGYLRGACQSTIQICPNCANPTYFQGHSRQIPGVPFGASVPYISDSAVEAIYEEAQRLHGSRSSVP